MLQLARAVVRRGFVLRSRFRDRRKHLKKQYRAACKRYPNYRMHQAVRVYGKRHLRDFYAAAREAGVTPFLMWGTLLGCVREGKLLPHDRDIDVGILDIDLAKKDALVGAMRWRGYALIADRDCKFKFARPSFDLILDIDVFFPWKDMIVCSSRQEDGSYLSEWFPQDAFAVLSPRTFLGVRVFVPEQPERILQAIYGDWQTPRPAYSSQRDPLNRLAGLTEFPARPGLVAERPFYASPTLELASRSSPSHAP